MAVSPITRRLGVRICLVPRVQARSSGSVLLETGEGAPSASLVSEHANASPAAAASRTPAGPTAAQDHRARARVSRTRR